MPRHKLDLYETDTRVTAYLIETVKNIGMVPFVHLRDPAPICQDLSDVQYRPGVVVEPCSGNGRMVHYLQHPYLNHQIDRVVTNDIDPDKEAHTNQDASKRAYWEHLVRNHSQPDWVITNAPFSKMHIILPLALEYSKVGVAFLGRLSYVEPTMSRNVRGDWLQQNRRKLSNLIVFGNTRPSFKESGATDNVTTAWMVWEHMNKDNTKVVFAHDWHTSSVLPTDMSDGCPSCGYTDGVIRQCNGCHADGCSMCVERYSMKTGVPVYYGEKRNLWYHDEPCFKTFPYACR